MVKTEITPFILCILDGFGCNESSQHNAISQANTPIIDGLLRTCPNSQLRTDSLEVGLPAGQMGNSEVGHQNIGAGRIIAQDLVRIDNAINDDTISDNAELRQFITKLQDSGGACHLMGLASDGGVHSHIDHIKKLAHIFSDSNIKVHIHAFLDGRDTPPKSAKQYITDIESEFAVDVNVNIATISGRYYAMDRDTNWDRIQLAHDAIISAIGDKAQNATQATTNNYTQNISDEFIKPVILADYQGVGDGDGVFMANFRGDRAWQILTALLDDNFDEFPKENKPQYCAKLGMTQYPNNVDKLLGAVFPAIDVTQTIGQVIADSGLKQLRIAETEKYPHVTFFLNGGKEDVFTGEDRILIASPKVATYDLQPEMSAPEVTNKLVEAIESEKYALIIVNFANGDMVGHTGVESATIKAIEQLDKSVGALTQAIAKTGAAMMIIADHGNAELMVNPETGKPHTAHTIYPVPCILVNLDDDIHLTNGRLSDVAPTILSLMGIEIPKQMTGKILYS